MERWGKLTFYDYLPPLETEAKSLQTNESNPSPWPLWLCFLTTLVLLYLLVPSPIPSAFHILTPLTLNSPVRETLLLASFCRCSNWSQQDELTHPRLCCVCVSQGTNPGALSPWAICLHIHPQGFLWRYQLHPVVSTLESRHIAQISSTDLHKIQFRKWWGCYCRNDL